MRASRGTPPERRGATVAQVKDDIDSGRAGDKVPGFDPAAAPLGTDDEAAGIRHDPRLLAETRADEQAGRPVSTRPNAATPELNPDGRKPRPPYAIAVLIGIVAAALAALLLLAVL